MISNHYKLADKISHREIKQALLIRKVEEKFLHLFSQGKLNGTVHTCVGQEFSAVAFAGQLKKTDFIFSNHRCHGHYIAFTKDHIGLLAELMGKSTGTCGGIGSSQHLCKGNFYSNGIQGGIVPVAAGYALSNKLQNNKNIGVVFIGDGTLGEGVLYETMNILSKWEIPLVIVCENNRYAQSTPQHINLAGDILKRAEAFGIKTYKGDTWQPENLMNSATDALNYVRENTKPTFFLVETYRLNPHSKGDDDRDNSEIEAFLQKDPLYLFEQNSPQEYKRYAEEIDANIDQLVKGIEKDGELAIEDYYKKDKSTQNDTIWEDIETTQKRVVERLNTFFKDKMEKDEKVIFLGEDILSPYGGAFKVSKDLSIKFPTRVLSTPISEAAIMGISNGLALNGFKPYIEIMFGDFITLALDQIINHASKFHHMFNKKVTCPVVIRTPMGGGRGYGPTHSQTLDKFLIGIDNVKTVAINNLIDPYEIYETIHEEKHPVIVIENKIDYGRRVGAKHIKNFVFQKETSQGFPFVRVRPIASLPTITIVAYGGMCDLVVNSIEDIFKQCDVKPELLVPSLISPMRIDPIIESVEQTGVLVIVEEGSAIGGIGSEIIASVLEQVKRKVIVKRIAALPVPIPSVKSLENSTLPSKEGIIAEIKEIFTNL